MYSFLKIIIKIIFQDSLPPLKKVKLNLLCNFTIKVLRIQYVLPLSICIVVTVVVAEGLLPSSEIATIVQV